MISEKHLGSPSLQPEPYFLCWPQENLFFFFSLFLQWLAFLLHLCTPSVNLTDSMFCSVPFIFLVRVTYIKFRFHIIALTDKNCCSRGINSKTLTWETRETILVKQCSTHDSTNSTTVCQMKGSWVRLSFKNIKQQTPTLSEIWSTKRFLSKIKNFYTLNGSVIT